MAGIETATGTLPHGKKIKVMLAPKNGTTPVTLTDIQYFTNNSGMLLEPSADKLSCVCSCDPLVDRSAMVGQTVEVTATGGGTFAKAVISVTDSAVDHPTATSLGITVGAAF